MKPFLPSIRTLGVLGLTKDIILIFAVFILRKIFLVVLDISRVADIKVFVG